MYWAQALASQNINNELKTIFSSLADELTNNEEKIVNELISVQGNPMDIDGYYKPDSELASNAMRPSATLNSVLSNVAKAIV